MNRPLEGRVALITGGNQGLGLAIARAYVEQGASVMLCARDERLLEAARAELAAVARSDQRVLAVPADVSNPASVHEVVAQTLAAFSRVHALVNNAGIYGPKGVIEDVDWKEWTRAMEINVYGSILMCRELVPHFKTHRYGKIIQLSGGGATNPMPRLSAYAASKAAIVRFAETLAEEVRGEGIDVNCIAPGALNTRMLDEVIEAGPGQVGAAFYEKALKQKQQGGAGLEKAAALAVFLASAASDGVTAKLISALWDPWADLPQRKEELDRSDVYTLRRIVPQDRGKSW
jgi:NAD(P)-dependent dehydrogenase (short-subunit alcohol dehydrogenase family)